MEREGSFTLWLDGIAVALRRGELNHVSLESTLADHSNIPLQNLARQLS